MSKLTEKLKARLNALEAKAQETEDINELRSIYAQIKDIKSDFADLDESRSEQPPADAVRHNAEVVASYRSATAKKKQENTGENPLASEEYRKEFMRFVQRNIPISGEMRSKINAYYNSLQPEQRAGLSISTDTTAAAIPIVLMQEIINTAKVRYGNIYAKVRKMAIPAGVGFAVGDLAAEFKWINESTVSPTQKTDDLARISFSYHEAECRIARSYLSTLLTLSDFESKLVEVIAVAYAKAMDLAIVRGAGNGSPLGIINDPRVTKVVTMTEAQINNWQYWKKNVFAEIPPAYADGEFIIPKATINAYLETMADSNNRPIYRETTGLVVGSSDDRYPRAEFFGHETAVTEATVLPAFQTANSGDVVAIFWQPWEYAINEPLGFNLKRYDNENTNQIVDKALFVADGKVLNPKGFILIKKA